MKRCSSEYRCPVEVTLELIGGKYKALILWHLRQGTLRFHQLRTLISGVTPKMLTQQLRELERDGFLIRTVYPVVPPKVEYAMTPLGTGILPVVDAMCQWGLNYLTVQESQSEQVT